jgi:hypothetical protein
MRHGALLRTPLRQRSGRSFAGAHKSSRPGKVSEHSRLFPAVVPATRALVTAPRRALTQLLEDRAEAGDAW